MGIRMIATDLDGTWLGGTEDRYGFLPESTAALRKAAQSARIAIASGRDFPFIVALLEREGIRCGEEGWPHYIIAEERCLYRLHNGKYEPDEVWNEWIRSEEALHFDFILQGVQNLLSSVILKIDGGARRQYSEVEQSRGYIEVSFSDASKAQFAEPILAAWVEQQQIPYVTVRNLADICIRHVKVGKGAMLARVGSEINILPAEVLAIGDSANDLSMLDGRYGFVGSCPSNAEEAIRLAVSSRNGYISKQAYGKGVADIVQYYTKHMRIIDGNALLHPSHILNQSTY